MCQKYLFSALLNMIVQFLIDDASIQHGYINNRMKMCVDGDVVCDQESASENSTNDGKLD